MRPRCSWLMMNSSAARVSGSGLRSGTSTQSGLTGTYTPEAEFFGTESFTRVANHGTADSASAAATTTVTAMNDAQSFTVQGCWREQSTQADASTLDSGSYLY